MRKMFVKTENYRKFVSAVKAVEQRGAAEAGMMLVYGVPGLGKSHIVSSWAGQLAAAFCPPLEAHRGEPVADHH